MELQDFKWSKAGFETIFELSGKIQSSAPIDLKDIRIECDLFAASGTKVSTVRETLYQVVPAGKTLKFSELSMGFMGSQQVETARCGIERAEPV